MKGWEAFGLAVVALVLLGTPTAIFAGQHYLNTPAHTYTLIGSATEDGGWSPHEITVYQGEHVHLRLTSADVSHGLMIPELDINVPEIYPGKFTTVDFMPTTPGTYPFTCTVVCSPRHDEMQGAIVVLPAEAAAAYASPPPSSASASAASSPASSTAPAASETGPGDEIATGKRVYQTFCLACHGPNAAGGLKLGNVTSLDLRSKALNSAFGGDSALIARAILNGKNASGKDLNIGMPRWQGRLNDAQVRALIAYLEQGT